MKYLLSPHVIKTISYLFKEHMSVSMSMIELIKVNMVKTMETLLVKTHSISRNTWMGNVVWARGCWHWSKYGRLRFWPFELNIKPAEYITCKNILVAKRKSNWTREWPKSYCEFITHVVCRSLEKQRETWSRNSAWRISRKKSITYLVCVLRDKTSLRCVIKMGFS